jgi:hypothetical protein
MPEPIIVRLRIPATVVVELGDRPATDRRWWPIRQPMMASASAARTGRPDTATNSPSASPPPAQGGHPNISVAYTQLGAHLNDGGQR